MIDGSSVSLYRTGVVRICFVYAGIVFKKVLEHAGVYKNTAEGQEAFMRFVKAL